MTGAWSHRHLYLNVVKCFPATKKWFCTIVSTTTGDIEHGVPKLWTTDSAKLLATHFTQFWRRKGHSATMLFVVHIDMVFSELPAPSSDHIWILQLAGDNISTAILSYALLNNYCHHKTETALHYSLSLCPSLSTAMHAQSHPTSNLYIYIYI